MVVGLYKTKNLLILILGYISETTHIALLKDIIKLYNILALL